MNTSPENDVRHRCRVCGYFNAEPPWGMDGKTPTYEVCPCCGAEAGYVDMLLVSIRKFREAWLNRGAPWSDPKFRPPGWDIEEQVRHIPDEFR